ncbi:hypothetical protein DYB28_005020 [Aphanomyces astaci]|uniref:ATPase dynein-related AAA domain-containing protein n=1 Tax=Aphanomyces astaci TaxID=112090 RepID=A0A9X8EER9_APHAT|nr:hypothetical protein DYB28_005020 [Aphanomyces astaci]
MSTDNNINLETLAHLRWMLQKDILHQDMFLIGYAKPGSHTSRREILGGSAIFADQAPVRAAIHGRILILDGTLHHSFIYDALLSKGHTSEQLTAQHLVRVDPAFRVIALGLPVPPYPGRTLDPPLRSRFQARQVPPPSPGAQLEICDGDKLVALVNAMHLIESGGHADRMPHLSASVVAYCTKMAQLFPTADLPALLRRRFPLHASSAWKAQDQTFQNVLRTFFPSTSDQSECKYQLTRVDQSTAELRLGDVAARDGVHRLSSDTLSTLQRLIQDRHVDLADGTTFATADAPVPTLTDIPSSRNLVRIHPAFRIVALGEVAKPWLTSETMALLPFHSVPELTREDADAVVAALCPRVPRSVSTKLVELWHQVQLLPSSDLSLSVRQLLRLARRLNAFPESAAADLRLLIEDTTMMHFLPNAQLMADVLDACHIRQGKSPDVAQGWISDAPAPTLTGTPSNLVRIHPAFRIVALGEVAKPWLTAETMALFPFHSVPELTREDADAVVAALCPRVPRSVST